MTVHVPAAVRRDVETRGGGRCEYCGIRGAFDAVPLQLDHTRPLSKGGRTDRPNLALACGHCNMFKGPSIAAFDPLDDAPAFLFNPRNEAWDDHFARRGGRIVGLTPAGRATVTLLRMNAPDRVRIRLRAAAHP